MTPVQGLNPSLASKYDHSASVNFTCLDGSHIIPFSAVNDDYCDCPDESDEPGTSACPTGVFYCENEGHIPGRVLSSRVNDGICDPECCDGSDEWATGACPNKCAEIGQEYRRQVEAEMKTRKTGARIRSTYIKWAQGERKRLQLDLETKRKELEVKEVEVEKSRIALETMEAKSKQEIEKRKKSPLFLSLLTHRLALSRLRSRVSRAEKELEALHGILEDLSKGYNPNYQDMAVKAAVVGYEELTKPPEPTGSTDDSSDYTEELEEEIGDRELDELERKDLEGILLTDISESDWETEEEAGLLWKIDEYIPESIYESWEVVRDASIDWLVRLGIIGKGSKGKTDGVDAPHVTAAREKHRNLNNELTKLQNDIKSSSETLEKMGLGFGPEAEWKKLDGTCVDTVAGDYTYELCFFGRASQKSNKDSSSNHLGTFGEWNTSAEPATYDYYTRQVYKNGAKCWNGPMRSVTVDMTCGTTNALLQISEPEKCEYRFKVTTPALCWPLDSGEQTVKEEL
ncbi:protein kinase C substrate 80K-H [Tremella mesenterica]|uniref:Glucosidase 2 subunit beta n=2 Tax=Tremella mesenterica TaxID=5217 RepID=A0A4V1M3F1_TREME|nr:protein kinase C substrate 80K-H [Tremella mesenterica]